MRRRESSPNCEAMRTGLLFGLAAAGGAAIGLGAHFARQVLTPARAPEAGVEVVRIDEPDDMVADWRPIVWLRGNDVALPGSYSFIFDANTRETQHLAGHARLGPVLATRRVRATTEVAREVLSIEQGDLRVGATGRITGWWFTAPEQLGYAVQHVALPLADGVAWGWVISPQHPTPGRWAVHVHGRGALPHETLRGVIPFAEAGITSLVIAYRNDNGAPSGRRGRYGLGIAEQFDVDSALGWVRQQGATSVTLVGWSMGATACVLAAANGANSRVVNGIVLDSPALDWQAILRRQARLAGVPACIADIGMWLMQCGVVRGAVPGDRGTDVASLSGVRLIDSIRVPTLIHASPDDTFVPWRASLRAAQHKSRLVRLHPSRGEHVKLWNVDRSAWEGETASFLATLQ